MADGSEQMSICDMTNLYVGYNDVEDFRVLIFASDVNNANEIAEEYRKDSDMQGVFDVGCYHNKQIRFDCDYILS